MCAEEHAPEEQQRRASRRGKFSREPAERSRGSGILFCKELGIGDPYLGIELTANAQMQPGVALQIGILTAFRRGCLIEQMQKNAAGPRGMIGVMDLKLASPSQTNIDLTARRSVRSESASQIVDSRLAAAPNPFLGMQVKNREKEQRKGDQDWRNPRLSILPQPDFP